MDSRHVSTDGYDIMTICVMQRPSMLMDVHSLGCRIGVQPLL